ncbi:MAG: hypothetical protein OEZ36_11490 [Spirochaetota bacterium]|nr:hypothetical protein [Spirochaetota bacterium]
MNSKTMFVSLCLFSALFAFSLSESVFAADGQGVFNKNGCKMCHFLAKGINAKPYPSKEQLAKLDYSTFKDKVTNGVSGTLMRGYSIGDGDMKAMYDWLQEFK